jgi:plasmid stabilization system protein ParE
MSRIRVRPQARLDLLEIWHYVARDSIDAANRMADQFDATMRRIAEMPGIGHVRADVKDPRYLFYSAGKYVIAYRVEGKTIWIIRVVHGARDFRKIFPRRRR